MKFSLKTGDLMQLEADCVVVATFTDDRLSQSADLLNQSSGGALARQLSLTGLRGDAGRAQMLYDLPGLPWPRVLLVGMGDPEKANRSSFGRAVNGAVAALKGQKLASMVFCLPEVKVPGVKRCLRVRDAVQGISYGLYEYTETKGKEARKAASKRATEIEKVRLFIGAEADLDKCALALAEGEALASGMRLARDLGNLPGNICTPSYLADQARMLANLGDALKVEVLEEEQMQELGMGALLSVSRGSRQPAKLIVMEYQGGEGKPVVLVGKGVTFDSGGISIKPGPLMDEMKFDMCGAASVIGTMRACVELKLPLNVVGLVPASENLPDGDASKPGDIVTSMSGQTIEVLNTDAEGRLILCDALTYAERFEPAAVVDVATLTGACAVALGQVVSGLFTEDDALAKELLDASDRSNDRAWRMPLLPDYQDQLDSNFADMANIGGKYGGAITAACFLSRYTKKYPWAHLDIAGVAWLQGRDKGSTARPVPLLTQFLIGRAKG